MKIIFSVCVLLVFALPAGAMTINLDSRCACNGSDDDSTCIATAIHDLPPQGGELSVPASTTCVIDGAHVVVDRPVTLRGRGITSLLKGKANPMFTTDGEATHWFYVQNVRFLATDGNDAIRILKSTGFSAYGSYGISDSFFEQSKCTGAAVTIEGAGGGLVSRTQFVGYPWCDREGTPNLTVGYNHIQIGGEYTMNNSLADSTFFFFGTAIQGRGERWELQAGLSITNVRILLSENGINIENLNDLGIDGAMIDQLSKSPIAVTNVSPFRLSHAYVGSTNKTGLPALDIRGRTDDVSVISNAFARYEGPSGPGVRVEQQVAREFIKYNGFGGAISVPVQKPGGRSRATRQAPRMRKLFDPRQQQQ